MNISRNTALAAVAAVAVAGGLYFGVKRALDPTRAPIPDPAAPIGTVEPKLDKLKPLDRQLVIGYLLLQRGEVHALSTQGFGFSAKTFREAMEAQKALLAAKQVSAEWPLMRALEEQALRPLRAAVPLDLESRRLAMMGDLFKSYPGALVVASGGAPDQPRMVMIYRIRNPGKMAIAHLTGYIQPKLASDAWVQPQTVSACRVELNNVAPGASTEVICAQADLDTIGDAAKTPDARLLIDWRPDAVEYADGSKLSYEANAQNNTLLWNRYDIGGDIR